MVGWNSIFGDLEAEPVRGEAASYETAGSEARRLHWSLDDIGQEFVRITSGANLEDLHGETADRLVDLITEVDGSLADVPAVFDDLDGLFSRHAERLVALRQRASDGLARAHARWSAVRIAHANHAAAAAELSSIESQLRCLRDRADDDEALSRIELLEHDLWRQHNVVANCQRGASDSAAELELSRGEYLQLVDDELELITTTIQAIASIPLGDLRDPNRLAQFAGDIVDGLVRFGRDAIEAVIESVLDLVRSMAVIAEVAITESLRVLAISIKGFLLTLVAIGTGVLQLLSKRFPPPSHIWRSGGRLHSENIHRPEESDPHGVGEKRCRRRAEHDFGDPEPHRRRSADLHRRVRAHHDRQQPVHRGAAGGDGFVTAALRSRPAFSNRA